MEKAKEGKPEPKRGRPSSYTDEIANAILERIAAGEGLNKICQDDQFPPESTVRGWAVDDVNGFSARYARAKAMRGEALAEEVIDIADTEPDPAVAKVRIDARKWYAGKVNQQFGDKATVEHTGKGGGAIENTLRVEFVDVGGGEGG